MSQTVNASLTKSNRNSLAAFLSGPANSIGFLRVALALIVMVHHSFTLRYQWEADPLWRLTKQLDLGSLAVESFLVLSGFLIAASFEKADNLPRYLWHRGLRLYPAFWMCLLVSAIFFAPLAWYLEHHSLSTYFATDGSSALDYVIANASLWIRQTNIGDLFGAHSTHYFNGSLWTLSLEATCYLLLPLVAYAGALGERRWLIMSGWILMSLWFLVDHLGWEPFGLHIRMFSLLKVGIYFGAGAVLYAFRENVKLNGLLAIGCLALIAIGVVFNLGSVFCLLALPYLVLWGAFKLPFVNWERKADLSYGTYVYAYPIQQLLLSAWPGIDALRLFLAAAVVVLPIALLSWRFIEQPALRWKHAGFVPRRLQLLRATRGD